MHYKIHIHVMMLQVFTFQIFGVSLMKIQIVTCGDEMFRQLSLWQSTIVSMLMAMIQEFFFFLGGMSLIFTSFHIVFQFC